MICGDSVTIGAAAGAVAAGIAAAGIAAVAVAAVAGAGNTSHQA
jgi:hypothetical protein